MEPTPKTIKLMAEYYGITENTMYNILTAMPHGKVERAIEYVKTQIPKEREVAQA